MNNSTAFNLAHKLAKIIRNEFDSYREAFSASLKTINSHKEFYKKMSFRITPTSIIRGHRGGAHGYFFGNVQYSIEYTSVDEKPFISEGFWM